MRPIRLILALALTVLAVPAAAQQACTDDAFRQFDYWVGEWTVSGMQNGNHAGTNRIEALHGGCVLVEHWEGAQGGGGTSMNYYDPVAGVWRQYWVSVNYSIEIAGGLDDDGAMVLEGELHNYRQKQAIPFRGTWTPLPDGDVRQLFEQQDSAGVWQVWFDGRYERVEGSGPAGR